MTDPLTTYFDELDALLVGVAKWQAPDDEAKQRAIVAWGWFCLVTDPAYLAICLDAVGVTA